MSSLNSPMPAVRAAPVQHAVRADAPDKSEQARCLAADIEHALADGRLDILTTEALQDLLASACRLYAARVESGEQILPCATRHGLSATDVMIGASGLLRVANLAVFELGMWQSWTGR